MVKVRVVVPPGTTFEAPKVFEIEGGPTTFRVALAALPVPALVDVIVLVVLVSIPIVVPCTVRVIVQELLALRPPFASATEPVKTVIVPEQVWFVIETIDIPLGIVSEKPIPDRAVVVLGFVMVSVIVVLPFKVTDVGLKDLERVGGPITVTVAVLDVVPVPPSFELTAPVVLFHTPVALPARFRVTWQFAPAFRLPPDRLREEAPEAAVRVPPQVFVAPGVAATVNPAGRESEKEIPDKAAPEFGLVI
jgi:hypothetical protein